jgi:hypothetical protein
LSLIKVSGSIRSVQKVIGEYGLNHLNRVHFS